MTPSAAQPCLTRKTAQQGKSHCRQTREMGQPLRFLPTVLLLICLSLAVFSHVAAAECPTVDLTAALPATAALSYEQLIAGGAFAAIPLTGTNLPFAAGGITLALTHATDDTLDISQQVSAELVSDEDGSVAFTLAAAFPLGTELPVLLTFTIPTCPDATHTITFVKSVPFPTIAGLTDVESTTCLADVSTTASTFPSAALEFPLLVSEETVLPSFDLTIDIVDWAEQPRALVCGSSVPGVQFTTAADGANTRCTLKNNAGLSFAEAQALLRSVVLAPEQTEEFFTSWNEQVNLTVTIAPSAPATPPSAIVWLFAAEVEEEDQLSTVNTATVVEWVAPVRTAADTGSFVAALKLLTTAEFNQISTPVGLTYEVDLLALFDQAFAADVTGFALFFLEFLPEAVPTSTLAASTYDFATKRLTAKDPIMQVDESLSSMVIFAKPLTRRCGGNAQSFAAMQAAHSLAVTLAQAPPAITQVTATTPAATLCWPDEQLSEDAPFTAQIWDDFQVGTVDTVFNDTTATYTPTPLLIAPTVTITINNALAGDSLIWKAGYDAEEEGWTLSPDPAAAGQFLITTASTAAQILEGDLLTAEDIAEMMQNVVYRSVVNGADLAADAVVSFSVVISQQQTADPSATPLVATTTLPVATTANVPGPVEEDVVMWVDKNAESVAFPFAQLFTNANLLTITQVSGNTVLERDAAGVPTTLRFGAPVTASFDVELDLAGTCHGVSAPKLTVTINVKPDPIDVIKASPPSGNACWLDNTAAGQVKVVGGMQIVVQDETADLPTNTALEITLTNAVATDDLTFVNDADEAVAELDGYKVAKVADGKWTISSPASAPTAAGLIAAALKLFYITTVEPNTYQAAITLQFTISVVVENQSAQGSSGSFVINPLIAAVLPAAQTPADAATHFAIALTLAENTGAFEYPVIPVNWWTFANLIEWTAVTVTLVDVDGVPTGNATAASFDHQTVKLTLGDVLDGLNDQLFYAVTAKDVCGQDVPVPVTVYQTVDITATAAQGQTAVCWLDGATLAPQKIFDSFAVAGLASDDALPADFAIQLTIADAVTDESIIVDPAAPAIVLEALEITPGQQTGVFVIRIAQGTTATPADLLHLLFSPGATPQDNRVFAVTPLDVVAGEAASVTLDFTVADNLPSIIDPTKAFAIAVPAAQNNAASSFVLDVTNVANVEAILSLELWDNETGAPSLHFTVQKDVTATGYTVTLVTALPKSAQKTPVELTVRAVGPCETTFDVDLSISLIPTDGQDSAASGFDMTVIGATVVVAAVATALF